MLQLYGADANDTIHHQVAVKLYNLEWLAILLGGVFVVACWCSMCS